MAAHIELYGVRNSGLEQTTVALAARLAYTFQERDSYYLGVYWVADDGSTEIKVVAQPDPEGDPFEDEFADYAILIYMVSDDPGHQSLRGIPVGDSVVELLRH
jgi:hypothetical protein